jgi:branched-chain amino acid transport system permease protein
MDYSAARRRAVSERTQGLGPIVVVAAVAIVAAIAVPPFLGSYFHYLGMLALINVIAATGLNILTGNAGQISLCNSSFMAIGAYATTYLYTKTGVPYWLALPFGALVSVVFGFALGFPALRLRGFYLAVVTLGFLELTQVLVEQLPEFTGGVRGVSSPRPFLFGHKLSSDLAFYYVVLAITLLVVWTAISLLNSPTGRAFNAIRNNESVAQTLSVPLARTKLTAFTLSAFYAGVAGGLYATAVGFIDPLEFGVSTSIRHIIYIVVGGAGSVGGSIIGAVVLTFLPEFLRGFKEYNDLVFGAILLASLLIMPKGIAGLLPAIAARFGRRSAAPQSRSSVRTAL